jgi:hypothetical protein
MNEMSAIGPSRAFKSALGAGLLLASLAIAVGSLPADNKPKAPADPRPTQPAVVFQLLDAQSSPAVFSRANSTRDALSLPTGVRRTGRHVKDSFQHAEFDEVDELDAKSDLVSLTQFEPSGRLRVAVRLDQSPHPATRIDGESASQAAQRGVAAAGLPVGGPRHVDSDVATDGWTVRWERTQNGVSVRGDETRVQVRPDGSIQSLARVEHQLAAEPTRRLDSDQAKRLVTNQAHQLFEASGSSYTIQKMDVEWVAPNDTFGSGQSADPQQAYRLAWVANVKPSGPAADYAWLVTVYIDAGDGSLLGGDIVE